MHISTFFRFLTLSIAWASVTALANEEVNFTKSDVVKDILVAGVSVADVGGDASSGVLPQLEVTLNVLVGGNECYAAQREVSVLADNTQMSEATKVDVEYKENANRPCIEIYQPVFHEFKKVIKSDNSAGLVLETNTQELKKMVLLAPEENVVIANVEALAVHPIRENTEWKAVTFRATVKTKCDLNQSKLYGYSYIYNSALRVAVRHETNGQGAACQPQDTETTTTFEFVGTYKPQSLDSLEIENFEQVGNISRRALPALIK